MRLLLTTVFAAVLVTGCTSKPAGLNSTVPPLHQPEADVVVYSGPNMRTSLERLAAAYKARTGQRVVVVADDIRPLIQRIKRERDAGQGVPDLFCTHDPFLQTLIADDVKVREAWPVASLVPVIVVAKGNPKAIQSIKDLARPGLRVGLTDAVQTISGEIMKVMFRRAGIDEGVRANVVVRTAQGRDLCKALIVGQCDVGIVWNAVIVGNSNKVEAIAIDEAFRPQRGVDAEVTSDSLGKLELDYVRVNLALLKDAKHPDNARGFVELVRSVEGSKVFTAYGFSPADPARPSLP
jgi:molybdate transport system substrate-binding protein